MCSIFYLTALTGPSYYFLPLTQEVVRDLLKPPKESHPLPLRILEGSGVCAVGATEFRVTNKDQIYDILNIGTSHRSQEATAMNARSSRSHAIFTIQL